MKTLIQKLEKDLAGYQKKLDKMNNECEKDESIQDDTDWVNDYHNLTGWVEALEYVIMKAKELDKKMKVCYIRNMAGNVISDCRLK